MRLKDIRVLLVGVGNWGRNHLKTLAAITNNFITYDKKDDLSDSQSNHPNEKDYDAVIIATTSHTHFDLTKRYLLEGKHVLCEKPVVKSEEELNELINIASLHHRQVFMAGHTMLYHNAIDIISKDAPLGGNLILRRMKHNPIKGDDEVYRLIPHDISIIDKISGGTMDCKDFFLDGNFLTFNIDLGHMQRLCGNVEVSWFQDPPIRDMYFNNGYFHDHNNTLSLGGVIQNYDRVPPLLREQLTFLELIAGIKRINPTNIWHTERVYRVLTKLRRWTPWTP